MGNKDMEMQDVPAKEPDKGPSSPSDAVDDKPPQPPKRDYHPEDGSMVAESKPRKKTLGSFPRPEVIYKPERSEGCMTCLKNTVVLFNLLIWVFGAALTGLGIWVKVDREFWDIQTGLDMKQFTYAAYVLIAVGVFIMLIAFLGCYGAMAQKLWMLVLYSAVVIIIILMEIAVMVLVWHMTNNKEMQMEMKRRARIALEKISQEEKQRYLVDLLQSKLRCCGMTGPDDYGDGPVPHSCTDPDTGFPNEQGCVDALGAYLKSKAGIVGGTAIAVFVLQLAALVFTLCIACGLKQAATNSVF